MELKLRLELAKVGSCNCLIKTHNPEYHLETCRYKAICNGLDEIERLRSIAQQVRDRLLRGDSDQELLALLDQANTHLVLTQQNIGSRK